MRAPRAWGAWPADRGKPLLKETAPFRLFRVFGCCDVRVPGFQGPRVSGRQGLRASGFREDFWNLGFQVIGSRIYSQVAVMSTAQGSGFRV